jgi:hypothetical protein
MSQHNSRSTIGSRRLGALAVAGAGLALSLGCQSMNTPLYFPGPQPVLEAQGGEKVPPSNGLTLRYRNPTMQEQMALDAQTAALNYGGDVPWVALDKIHIEVSYQVTNLSDSDGVFNVMVDGASQYEKYDSKTVAAALQQGNNDPPTYLPLMQSHSTNLGAHQSSTGLLREDDFAEASLDLDALGRWNDAATKTFAAVLVNRSDVNPVGLELVPKNLVVPAFVEIDVNLQTDVHMTCDYMVRVRDDDDRLLHDDGDTRFHTSPTLFAPPAAM